MKRSDPRRERAALALMCHAIVSTKPQTAEETVACNIRFTRARDLLVHGSALPVVYPQLSLTAAAADSLRDEALANLRSICRACGLCERFGLKSP